MLEVWGRRNSSNVMTVMWTLGELGLEYRRHNVGGSFGGLDSTEYLAMNPNRVIPTLVDGSKVLWESNAIARYLAAAFAQGSLWPEDAYQRALADRWMDWSKTVLLPTYLPVFFNLIRKPPDQQNLQAVEQGVAACRKVMMVLEAQLQHSRFVAGDQLTMGDLPLGPIIYRYLNLEIERPDMPAIQSWYERLCERQAFRKHVMIPFGRSFEEWGILEKESAGIQ